MSHVTRQAVPGKTYVVTGPTSGYGRGAALELAKHGTVVLVGRDPAKLAELQRDIEGRGQQAASVVCDLSDLESVRRAAAEIAALELPVVGLLNNAGIRQSRATQNALGWDLTFATNHLGPFALTEALAPYLPDGATVLFVCSAVEDPERKGAKAAGFRGGRYLSAEASARGEWAPGGSVKPGFDAYATSKQCNLATALAFARETPRLRFHGIEPGFSPATGLSRDANALARLLAKVLFPLFASSVPGSTNPRRAARVIAEALRNEHDATGLYFDERGQPMTGSPLVSDPSFQDRVVAETRALLATIPTHARAVVTLQETPAWRGHERARHPPASLAKK